MTEKAYYNKGSHFDRNKSRPQASEANREPSEVSNEVESADDSIELSEPTIFEIREVYLEMCGVNTNMKPLKQVTFQRWREAVRKLLSELKIIEE